MEIAIPVVLAILGILGGSGVWTYIQSRKEAPVKKRDADMAAADKSVQMALSVATAARDDSAALRVDLNTEREERQFLSGRVEELSQQLREQTRTNREQSRTIKYLRAVERTYIEAWEDLVRGWPEYRLSLTAPDRPHLRRDENQENRQ